MLLKGLSTWGATVLWCYGFMYMYIIKLNACRRTFSRPVYTEGDVINPVSIGGRSAAQAKVVNNFLFTLHWDNSEAPERHDIRLGAGPLQPRGQVWAVMLRRVARWRCISLKVFLIQFVGEKFFFGDLTDCSAILPLCLLSFPLGCRLCNKTHEHYCIFFLMQFHMSHQYIQDTPRN